MNDRSGRISGGPDDRLAPAILIGNDLGDTPCEENPYLASVHQAGSDKSMVMIVILDDYSQPTACYQGSGASPCHSPWEAGLPVFDTPLPFAAPARGVEALSLMPYLGRIRRCGIRFA